MRAEGMRADILRNFNSSATGGKREKRRESEENLENAYWSEQFQIHGGEHIATMRQKCGNILLSVRNRRRHEDATTDLCQ